MPLPFDVSPPQSENVAPALAPPDAWEPNAVAEPCAAGAPSILVPESEPKPAIGVCEVTSPSPALYNLWGSVLRAYRGNNDE